LEGRHDRPHSSREAEANGLTGYGPAREDRIKGAAGSAVLVVLIGYGLIVGLGVDFPRSVVERLQVVALQPDSPPPRPDPVCAPTQAEKREEGAASPPNLRSKATEIVAPVAGLGSDTSAGAAPVIGPGTGSGGQGEGLGGGNGGDGDGGGGGTEAELVSNTLRYKNLPRALWDVKAAGMVTYRATLGVNGRLSDCRVTRSSGNAALDAATCALALRHAHFSPARNENGRKVADTALFEQEWRVEQREVAEPDDSSQ